MTAATMGDVIAQPQTAPSWRRRVEAIWHIEGAVPLAQGQSAGEAFDRLAPLFRQTGTTVQQRGDTLTFHKVDPAAQDPMAVFDSGVLEADTRAAEPVLRYRLVSRALLLCFLAPLLFLSFAGATILVARWQAPAPAEKKEKKQVQLPQNPIDKMLGAPAPEAPKKDKKPDEKKPKPTAAYVFAGIFAFLYLAGRILEDRLVRRAFVKRLAEEPSEVVAHG